MKSGSSYCDYERAFQSYDSFRRPCGLREVHQVLDHLPVPMDRAVLLEGGFGTGAYTYHLARLSCRVIGIEASNRGITKARRRLETFEKVHLARGNILSLPLKEACIDAYFISQVLHHLDQSSDFPNMTRFLEEAHRVLKTQGFLILHTCDPAQIDPHEGSYWYYEFIPTAARKLQSKYVPLDLLRQQLQDRGFSDIQIQKSSGCLYDSTYYEDPTLFLTEDFWASDSVFCLVDDEERSQAHRKALQAMDDGSIHAIMEKHVCRAREIGESVIISARKGQ
ncbi:class I SAM-dependent methyltransferase [Desulfacinum hydrothermale]|uniref:class I SAM-dependent methyltransferase n=1 Tax=Desulfacinum hydrothermale TaxID=109258 RepID=UPI00148335A1|nr:class I SAM-dependent methyltransferase [Desulfacinum hydrothermale]